jgi:GTP-binding protein
MLLSRTENVFDEYRKKIATSKFNTFLKDIWERKHPSLYRGKTLKFFYSTQVKSGPPTFLIFVNYPTGIHFSYRRYIENRIREEFGFEGTPLRIVFKDRR